jgi:hypothetical protein
VGFISSFIFIIEAQTTSSYLSKDSSVVLSPFTSVHREEVLTVTLSIPVGPAAAGITLGIALIVGVALWRYSPLRKRSPQQLGVELTALACSPVDPSPDTREPLPQYRPREADDYPPGYSMEQPVVSTAPPEYPKPVAGQTAV